MFIKLQTLYFHVICAIELSIIIFNNMTCHIVLFFKIKFVFLFWREKKYLFNHQTDLTARFTCPSFTLTSYFETDLFIILS